MDDTDEKKGRLPEKIALCLSGGGYRAAAFHLGALDYLERLGLLSKLTMLSTVSGGTYVGTGYTLALVEKAPFPGFFMDCYQFLRDQRYMENLLPYLGTERPDRTGHRRNMIQAAAELYANTFLQNKKTGKPYLLGTLLDSDIPLTAIFNATSFYSGESFIFRKGQGEIPHWVGTTRGTNRASADARLSPEDARNVRLADIAAASTCFPGGFEPMAFPQDFVWPGEVPPLQQYRVSSETVPGTIPLMDGGVADNVGLTTLMESFPSEGEDLDLIIASDVDPKPVDLYKDFPLKRKATSFLQKESRIRMTLQTLHRYLIAVVVFLALTMIGQGIYTWNQFDRGGSRWSSLFFYLIALLLSVAIGGSILWVCRLFRKDLLGWFDEKMGRAGNSWDIFKNITLGQASNMVKLRISSVLAMTTNVFMCCIRELTYVLFQENPDYNSRFIANTIYCVTAPENEDFIRRDFPPVPTEKLHRVVDPIVNMESTLWWQKDYQLPCLVACGQISLCLSLFMHYYNPEETDPEILAFLDRLRADWKNLNENPFYFLEERYPQLKPFPFPPDGKS